jgi:hypothetical protein
MPLGERGQAGGRASREDGIMLNQEEVSGPSVQAMRWMIDTEKRAIYPHVTA